MTQVLGIPYRRHGPSAALRQFLDHLDPGDYFDCGRARLHGLDDALLEEARQRGLDPGDDAFVLVATDTGLIFCRPSISYAITARWDEITVTRPRGDDPVVLPVRWPRHGELKFTVSRRLAGNVFRRWLQLRVQADRVARETRQTHLRAITGQNPLVGAGRDRSGPGDPDAEITGEPAMGDLAPFARIGSTGPAPEGSSGSVLEPEHLLDDELRRVPKPGADGHPPSWVGSAVSMAATLVVLTTVVLLVAVSVGLYRGVTGRGSADGEVAVEAADDRTTIDHRRFQVPVEGSGPAGRDTTTSSSTALPVSASGGASEVDSTSSQQLLAAPPGASGRDPLSPLSPSVVAGATRCNSNYSGCVPDVSDLELDEAAGIHELDVDCPDGGDGPWFADGEVTVLGDDVYELDADGDGRACEPDEGKPAVAGATASFPRADP